MSRGSPLSERRPTAFLVSQWFLPEPAGQALRAARLLEASGYDTEVVTGIPNYPSGVVPEGYRATQVRSERVAGFTVHRTPLYPSHDGRALRRILNYVSWALSSTVFAAWRLRRAAVVLVYSSPATAALPAIVARRLFRTPYVLLIQDVWPDSVFSSGFLNGRGARVVRRLIEIFVNWAYREASQILVISPGMVELLASRGVARDKLSLLYNAVDTAQMTGAPSDISRPSLGISDDAFVLMYAGNHGAAQSLDVLVDAVGRHENSDKEVHLVMVGDGLVKNRLEGQAAAVAPGRVHLLGSQPREAMASLMEFADVQVVSLANEPLFEVTMPSKVQGMMAMGQPVLAVAAGDVSDVVTRAECGLAARPGDVDDVADAIHRLMRLSAEELTKLGAAGRNYYEANMTDAVGVRSISSALRKAQRDG